MKEHDRLALMSALLGAGFLAFQEQEIADVPVGELVDLAERIDAEVRRRAEGGVARRRRHAEADAATVAQAAKGMRA